MSVTNGPSVAATPPPLPTPPGEPIAFSWSGPTWGLAGLGFINLLLTVITLGIYQFWAKTEVRRRITSSIRVNGEPVEYTGTGLELFLGFLIVFGVLLVPFLIITVAAQITLGRMAGLALLPVYLVVWYLYGVAVYRARRYRRSRLRWRGVRGAVTGSSFGYAWHYLWTTIVGALAYGWLTPWRDNMLHRILIRDTRFGDRSFQYTGKAGPLYPSYSLAWVGSIVLLLLFGGLAFGLLWPMSQPLRDAAALGVDAQGKFDPQSPIWKEQAPLIGQLVSIGVALFMLYALFAGVLWSLFHAREYRYFSSMTSLEGLTFHLDVKGWNLFWLFFSNTLMSIMTFTILSPVAEARVSRYFIRRLSATGSIDFATIQQSQMRLSRTGEGLAEALDVELNEYFILSI